VIKKEDLGSKDPPAEAYKGQRQVYRMGTWHTAELYEMDRLRPGNEVGGMAIIEAPATTFYLPPGWKAIKDEYHLFRLTKEG
jgi:N-methylhydantoinase A/oxoprolinase/acetone carboxylase beta subunit